MKKNAFIIQLTKSNALLLSQCFALLYWLNCNQKEPSYAAIVFKVLSTFLLSLHIHETQPQKKSLKHSLLCHSLGDLLIELPIENRVLISMPCFFFGHLRYSQHLFSNATASQTALKKNALPLFAFSAFAAFTVSQLQSRTEGVISQAIPFYAAGLGSVFILALLQKERRKETLLSASSYVASDILIAINMLIQSIPYLGYLTWALYFHGQLTMVKQNTVTEVKEEAPRKTRRIVFV